jgi:hypothetical protein
LLDWSKFVIKREIDRSEDNQSAQPGETIVKMSFWSTTITVGVAAGLLALVATFAVRTTPAASAESAQPAAGATAPATTGDVAVADQAAALEAAFRTREAEYQAQVQQVNTLLQARQTLYSQQLTEWGARANDGEALLQQLTVQEQTLRSQIAQLEQARAERLAQYQGQVAEARNQFATRAATINGQLAEAQARLAEANAMLGR